MQSLYFSNNMVKSLVGKVFFAHSEKYDSSSAFEIGEAAKIRILLPRLLGVVSVSVHIFNESLDREEYRFSAYWSDSEKEYDVYVTPQIRYRMPAIKRHQINDTMNFAGML